MDAETQRAPRVAREQTSMADAALTAKHAARHEAMKTLGAFSFNETTPFHGSGTDLAWDCLDKAHALTVVLSNLIGSENDGEHSCRNVHLSKAFDAVGILIALAQFGTEAEL